MRGLKSEIERLFTHWGGHFPGVPRSTKKKRQSASGAQQPSIMLVSRVDNLLRNLGYLA